MISNNKRIFLLMQFCLYYFFSLGAQEKNIQSESIAGNKIILVQPDEERILRNPLTGWVLYTTLGSSADHFWAQYDRMEVRGAAPVKLSDYAHTLYIRGSWTDFNPQEDVYGWEVNENIKAYIEGAYQRNMRLAFRIVVDSRDKRSEFTPAYVKAAGAKGFVTKGKWSPYADDPIFQKYYTKFVKAFARVFNDPAKVDFIDGFGLGKWGEYHTMIYSTGDEKPRKAVFEWITDIYSEAFDKVPVLINYHRWIGTGKDWVDDAHYDPESEEMLDKAIQEKGYSLRHDAFGMTTYYGSWERKFAEKYRYIRPIIMEGGWIVSSHRYWQDPRKYRQNFCGDVRKGEMDDSEEAHVNMMDFRYKETLSWFEDTPELVQKFIKEGGYRLYPSRISLPVKIKKTSQPKISHCWNNMGWGYCPTNIPQWNQKYKVAFALLDKKTEQVVHVFVDVATDLSKWIKGSPVEYTFLPDLSAVKKGTYVWAVGLVDSHSDNQIGLEMAAKGELLDSGWLKLIEVNIK